MDASDTPDVRPPAYTLAAGNIPDGIERTWQTRDVTMLLVAADALDEAEEGAGLWCRVAARLFTDAARPPADHPDGDDSLRVRYARGLAVPYVPFSNWTRRVVLTTTLGVPFSVPAAQSRTHRDTKQLAAQFDAEWRYYVGVGPPPAGRPVRLWAGLIHALEDGIRRERWSVYARRNRFLITTACNVDDWLRALNAAADPHVPAPPGWVGWAGFHVD